LYTNDATNWWTALWEKLDSVENWATLEVINDSKIQFVDAIVYWASCAWDNTDFTNKPAGCTIIEKSAYRDFFRIGESYAQVYRTTN
jgi:hypothetical protein